MTVLWLAICILASYRVSRAISLEDGPFDIFSRFQEWVGGSKNWIGRGLSCVMCTSVWISLFITILAIPLLPIYGVPTFVLIWLGQAGAVALLYKVIG